MRIGAQSATAAAPAAAAGSAAFTACDGVGGQRAVYISPEGCVAHASASDLAHYERVLGLTQAAADADSSVSVQWSGEMRDPSFTGRFTAGPVWLGENGALTQAPPAAGFLQQLALFVPPDRLILKIGEPVQLTSDGT